jgi:hypothetical protein
MALTAVRVTNSPFIVPEIAIDAALTAAVATIQQLAQARREGSCDAVPQFERVPGCVRTSTRSQAREYAQISAIRACAKETTK